MLPSRNVVPTTTWQHDRHPFQAGLATHHLRIAGSISPRPRNPRQHHHRPRHKHHQPHARIKTDNACPRTKRSQERNRTNFWQGRYPDRPTRADCRNHGGDDHDGQRVHRDLSQRTNTDRPSTRPAHRIQFCLNSRIHVTPPAHVRPRSTHYWIRGDQQQVNCPSPFSLSFAPKCQNISKIPLRLRVSAPLR